MISEQSQDHIKSVTVGNPELKVVIGDLFYSLDLMDTLKTRSRIL